MMRHNFITQVAKIICAKPKQPDKSLGTPGNSLVLLFLVSTLYCISSNAADYEIQSPRHCLGGCPSNYPISSDLIIRNIYIMSTNDVTKFADWVAYKVTRETIGKPQKFELASDPLLNKSETLELEDFKDIGPSQHKIMGFQVPLTSFAGSPYWKDTYLLSNVTPQNIDLNNGVWYALEQRVRDMALQPEIVAVYVMTGPIFEDMQAPLPNADEMHIVPSGYWKIIAIRSAGNIKTAGFYFDQKPQSVEDYCTHLVTVANIEQRTGLKFFHELDYQDQQRLKQTHTQLRTELGC